MCEIRPIAVPTVEQLMKFYFLATQQAWPSGKEACSIYHYGPMLLGPIPDTKGFIIRDDTILNGNTFTYIDQFLTRANDCWSAGQTNIFFDHDLIWTMSYGGFYEKEAIPVVKTAIMETATIEEFNGGRGLWQLEMDGLIYRNQNAFAQDFTGFQGIENVQDNKGRWLGYHSYWGMLLMPH